MQEIGNGSQGSVLYDGNYAHKKIYDLNSAMREIYLLNTINHDNIIRMISHNIFECTFTMEVYPIELSRYKTRGDIDVVTISYDLASAIQYLHTANIIHCDIKPSNVLITQPKLSAILCDFGIASLDHDYLKNSRVQTVMYRAPEIDFDAQECNYDSKIDVWSLGCIFYELITHRVLFPVVSKFDATKGICKYFKFPIKDYRQNYEYIIKLTYVDILKNLLRDLHLTPKSRLYPLAELMAHCLNPHSNFRSNADTVHRVLSKLVQFDYPEIKPIRNFEKPFHLRPIKVDIDEMNVLSGIPDEFIMEVSRQTLIFAERIYTMSIAIKLTTIEKQLGSIYLSYLLINGKNPYSLIERYVTKSSLVTFCNEFIKVMKKCKK